ncbi:MAG: beta-ketoacyl-ACP reductase [Anaerolineae bacterium]
MRLQDRVALVTGGAAGIGQATAQRFAEEGAKVVICDLNEEAGKKTAEDIGGHFHQVTVADRDAVRAWIDDVVEKHERIDVLVNNAGIVRDRQLVKYKNGDVVSQMAEEDWDSVIAVNLKGVFNCTQAVVPTMIRQNSGVILNASSVVGLDGNFGQTNYVATKAGVVGMTKVWARELGRYGIRVNAVAPGFIATEILRDMPEKVLEGMVNRTPLKRMGEPVDIANAYVFLASDEASYISGTVLRVDGGIVVGT